MIQKPLAIFLLFSAVACSQSPLDTATYRETELRRISIEDENWIIKENEQERSFLLISSLATMYGDIGREAVTYSLAKDRGTTLPEFQPAAEVYIKAKGCSIISGSIIQRHTAEFQYTC